MSENMSEVQKKKQGWIESVLNGKTETATLKRKPKSPLEIMASKIGGKLMKKTLYNTRHHLAGQSSQKPGNIQPQLSTKPVPKKPSSGQKVLMRSLMCKKCHLPIKNLSDMKSHNCFLHHCYICPPGVAFKNVALLERHLKTHTNNETGKTQSVESEKSIGHQPTDPVNLEKPSTSSSLSSIKKVAKKRKLTCLNCRAIITSEKDKMFCTSCSKLHGRRSSEVPKIVKKTPQEVVPSTKKTTVTSRKEVEVKKKKRRVVRKQVTLKSGKSYPVVYSEKINFRCHKCYYGSITKVMYENHFKQDCAKRTETMTRCVVLIKKIKEPAIIKEEQGVEQSEMNSTPIFATPAAPTPKKTFTCRPCKEIFPDMDSFNFHVEVKHATMLTHVDYANTCALCANKFHSSVALSLHECNPNLASMTPFQLQQRQLALNAALQNAMLGQSQSVPVFQSPVPNYPQIPLQNPWDPVVCCNDPKCPNYQKCLSSYYSVPELHPCCPKMAGGDYPYPPPTMDPLNSDVDKPTMLAVPSANQYPFDELSYLAPAYASSVPSTYSYYYQETEKSDAVLEESLVKECPDKDNLVLEQGDEKDTNECQLKILGVCSLRHLVNDNLTVDGNDMKEETDTSTEDRSKYICLAESCYESVGSQECRQHFEEQHSIKVEEADIANYFAKVQE